MKANGFVSLLLSVADVATAIKFVSGPTGWPSAMGFNVTTQSWANIEHTGHSKRAIAPKRQNLKSRAPNVPNSKSVKIRYGPYTVPAPRVPGGEGMIWNMPTPSIEKPCSKCMIIGMNAGLEYAEGEDANIDTKLWLHHMVLFNIGTNAWDATCTVFGLPHMIVGSLPMSSERIFSSGNERTMALFNPPKEGGKANKLGYPVFANDRFGLIADLMNMNPTSKQVWMTMYYDYVEGHPADYEEIKPVWFDVAQCGTSEVSGRSAGANFDVNSSPWIANFDGEIIGVGGHIHDGGTHLDVMLNKDVNCRSTAYYGTGKEARVRGDVVRAGGVPNAAIELREKTASAAKNGGGHDHAGGQHIIAMSVCGSLAGHNGSPVSPLKNGKVSKGQSWTIRAHYDYKVHNGMKNNQGGMDSVMGIAIMFVKTAKKMRTT